MTVINKNIINIIHEYYVSLKYTRTVNYIKTFTDKYDDNSRVYEYMLEYRPPRLSYYTYFNSTVEEDDFRAFKSMVRITMSTDEFCISTSNYHLILLNYDTSNCNRECPDIYMKTNYNIQTMCYILLNLNLIERHTENYFIISTKNFQNKMRNLFKTVGHDETFIKGTVNIIDMYEKILHSTVNNTVYIDRINMLANFEDSVIYDNIIYA